MTDDTSLKERMEQQMELDESRFLVEFHQSVEQRREKAWHDRHIKKKAFKVGDHVLLYASKFQKFLGKLQMHWLGSFIVTEIKDSRVLNLAQLEGIMLPRWVNNERLKPFYKSIAAP